MNIKKSATKKNEYNGEKQPSPTDINYSTIIKKMNIEIPFLEEREYSKPMPRRHSLEEISKKYKKSKNVGNK